jgi:hypothetical protein
MHGFTGDDRWRTYAMEIVAPLTTVVGRAPLAVAGLAAAMELVVGPMREVAISGDAHAEDTRALVAVVQRRFDPLRVLAWGAGGDVPLLDDRPAVDGRATAYVCRGFVCKAPVTEVSALEREISEPG